MKVSSELQKERFAVETERIIDGIRRDSAEQRKHESFLLQQQLKAQRSEQVDAALNSVQAQLKAMLEDEERQQQTATDNAIAEAQNELRRKFAMPSWSAYGSVLRLNASDVLNNLRIKSAAIMSRRNKNCNADTMPQLQATCASSSNGYSSNGAQFAGSPIRSVQSGSPLPHIRSDKINSGVLDHQIELTQAIHRSSTGE